jgi:molybdate transport system substrate-binding protein
MQFRLLSAALVLAIASTVPAFAADKTSLVALVASNAKAPFTEIIAAYEKSHPDISVSATYVGSNVIAKEIASGAAADVVLIAQPAIKDTAGGLDSPVLVYTNKAAIGVNKSAVGKIKEAKDLMKPGVKIAEGTAGSTTGTWEAQVVDKMTAHYGKDFATKYGANVVGKKTDTAKVTEMVESGTADAAILYESNVDPAKLSMIKLGAEDLVTVPTMVATVKASSHSAAAKAFAVYIAGAEAAAVLKSHRMDTSK